MFKHNLKYNLKTLFKNKALIFWTYAFPLIIGTFFYLAFHDIEKNETFKAIPIAVINNKEWQENDIWKNTIANLSDENEDGIFNTTYKTIEEAKNDLEEGKIKGYLLLEGNSPKVIIKENGTSETILKNVIEESNQKQDSLNLATKYNIKIPFSERLAKEISFVLSFGYVPHDGIPSDAVCRVWIPGAQDGGRWQTYERRSAMRSISQT